MSLRSMVDWVLEQPAVYSAWQAPFASQKFAPLERRLGENPIGRVLDVGCGPGTNAGRFAAADYVGVDINERYLQIARATYGGRFIQADLECDDLSSLGVFDTIIVNSFLHHLDDDAVVRVLGQLHRLLNSDGRVHFLELVLPKRPSLARLMATLDRGRYARALDVWQAMFTSHFEPMVIEPYQFGCGLWAMVYFQGEPR